MARTLAENTLPPLAYLARIAAERAAGRAAMADLLEAGVAGQRLRTARVLQPYVARPLTGDATLYHGPGDTGTRRLLIAFTGSSMRLMMPIALFLQAMDARAWEVLVLCDPERSHFRAGLPGIAPTFPAPADWIGAIAAACRGIAAIGTSLGGLSATRLALHRGGMRAIAVGGRAPVDTMRLFRQAPPPAFDPICACLPVRARDLLFVAPASNAPDMHAARRGAMICGGQVVALNTGGAHIVLWDLAEAGHLRGFLRLVLDDATPPQAMPRALALRGIAVEGAGTGGRIARLAMRMAGAIRQSRSGG